MAQARFFHTATLLPNGKVLVAGGCGDVFCNSALASTELYDPATGVWTTIAAMATARFNHTATLLPNGKVLVAGGCTDTDCNTALISAELYDPATGTWTPTGSMSAGRFSHTATLLRSGRVLVAGGTPGGITSTELYNPHTGTWAPGATMTSPRESQTATLLPNGQVLAAGGCCSPGPTSLASAELYTPELPAERRMLARFNP